MVTSRKSAPQAAAAPKSVTAPKAAAPKAASKTAPTKAVRTRSAPQKAPAKPLKAAVPAPTAPKADKKSKPEKIKVVRDSFTIPKSEYAAIADLKKRALAQGTEVKKSELIRAGLALLVASSDAAFGKALAQVPTLKTGRPGKA